MKIHVGMLSMAPTTVLQLKKMYSNIRKIKCYHHGWNICGQRIRGITVQLPANLARLCMSLEAAWKRARLKWESLASFNKPLQKFRLFGHGVHCISSRACVTWDFVFGSSACCWWVTMPTVHWNLFSFFGPAGFQICRWWIGYDWHQHQHFLGA